MASNLPGQKIIEQTNDISHSFYSENIWNEIDALEVMLNQLPKIPVINGNIQQKLYLYDEYMKFQNKDENFEEKLDFLLLQKKRKFHHKLERTFKTLITPELGEVIESDYRNIVDKREYDYQCLMERFKNKKRKSI